MQRIKTEIELFLVALGFLTRVPIPRWVSFAEDRLRRAARYYPWVGVVVGAVGAGAFLGANAIFAHPLLALLLSLVVTLLLTGAFHEDGFADFCDGFGGGRDAAEVREIMKDSRIGTYGALGLLLIVLIRVLALSLLPPVTIAMALLLAHGWSRLAATSLLIELPYITEDGKSGALASELGLSQLLYAALPLLPLLMWFDWRPMTAMLIAIFLTRQLMAIYLRRRLDGLTGDCLGATQQLVEVFIYLALLGSIMLTV